MAKTMVPVTIIDGERKLTHSGIPYVNLQLKDAWGEDLWTFIAIHPTHQSYWRRVLGSLLNEYEWLALSLATRQFDPDECFFFAEEIVPHLVGKSTVVAVVNSIFGHQFRRVVEWV